MEAVSSSETFTKLYGGTLEKTMSILNSKDSINCVFWPRELRSVIKQPFKHHRAG
jgi:hypothetical protein